MRRLISFVVSFRGGRTWIDANFRAGNTALETTSFFVSVDIFLDDVVHCMTSLAPRDVELGGLDLL